MVLSDADVQKQVRIPLPLEMAAYYLTHPQNGISIIRSNR